MGFTEVLTIVFIVLKLLGVITWSWWLVLLPEIIALVIYIVVVVVQIVMTNKLRKEIREFHKSLK